MSDSMVPSSSSPSFSLSDFSMKLKTHNLFKTEDLNSNKRFNGRYELRKRLGAGGFGEVYQAYDHNLNIDIALKFLKSNDDDPESNELFINEARKLAIICHELNNPNICKILDIGFDDEIQSRFISMQLYPNGSLNNYVLEKLNSLEKNQRSNPRYIGQIVKLLAETLQLLHDLEVIHRDLKPANILIDNIGNPVISDFGLAWHPNHDFHTMGWGTPPYMSPESIGGNIPSKSDDIYALGMILYELLSGTIEPFIPHGYEKRPKLAGDAGAFNRVISASTARLARNRFQSMSEMAVALSEIVGQSPFHSCGEPPFIEIAPSSKVSFLFLKPGSPTPIAGSCVNRVFLNIGQQLGRGVIDKHQGRPNVAGKSTSRLVIENPQFVYSVVRPNHKDFKSFLIVTSNNLSLDALIATFLAKYIVTKGCLPVGAIKLVEIVEKGFSGGRGAPHIPLAICAGLIIDQSENDIDGIKMDRAVHKFHKIIEFILKEHYKRGAPINEINVFKAPHIFSKSDASRFKKDNELYQLKLVDANCKASSIVASIPNAGVLGGSRIVDGLLIRNVRDKGDPNRVLFFSEWAYADTHFPKGKAGFHFVCVHCLTMDGKRRSVVSVEPDSGLSLQNLAVKLEIAEVAKRKKKYNGIDDREIDVITGITKPPRLGFGNSDPWYDGRGHNYTIIDSPREGTLLSEEEVEDIIVMVLSLNGKRSRPIRLSGKGLRP